MVILSSFDIEGGAVVLAVCALRLRGMSERQPALAIELRGDVVRHGVDDELRVVRLRYDLEAGSRITHARRDVLERRV